MLIEQIKTQNILLILQILKFPTVKGSLGCITVKEIKHASVEYSACYMAIKQTQNDTMDKDANPSQPLAYRIPDSQNVLLKDKKGTV